MVREPNKPYHRRYGTIYRPGILGAPERPSPPFSGQNDGGEDAPLSPSGRVIFWSLLLVLFVVFVALVVLTYRGY